MQKEKITVNLKGGLGNQLFQILAGVNYAKKHNKDFFIDYSNQFHASQGNHPNEYKSNLFEAIFLYCSTFCCFTIFLFICLCIEGRKKL